jgi:hypothetical protein
MEEFLFKRPEVARELGKFVEARLHTDGFGALRASSLRNQERQRRLTGTLATPVYVVLDPGSERVLGTFEGPTRVSSEFTDWLESARRLLPAAGRSD